MSSARDRAIAEVAAALDDLDLRWSRSGDGLFTVSLPGTKKLLTECAIEVGRHTLGLRAFVARRPDENHAGVYRWLLERNLKLVRGLVLPGRARRHLPDRPHRAQLGRPSGGRPAPRRGGRDR